MRFIDRHHHGVSNSDGRYKQGYGTDTAKHSLIMAGLLFRLFHPVGIVGGLKAHVGELF